MNKVENVMHAAECNTDHMLRYIVVNFAKLFSDVCVCLIPNAGCI